MSRWRRTAAVIAIMTTAGCVQQTKADFAVPGSTVRPLSAAVLPGHLLGLQVAQEDVSSSVRRVRQTYLHELSLYSLRRGKLLEATLEVGAFDPLVVAKVPGFTSSVVSSVSGESLPQRGRLGPTEVWFVRGIQQRLALWFTRDRFFVMSIRDDFPLPITLIRRTLALVDNT